MLDAGAIIPFFCLRRAALVAMSACVVSWPRPSWMLALSIDFVVRVQPRCLPAVSGGRGDVGRDR